MESCSARHFLGQLCESDPVPGRDEENRGFTEFSPDRMLDFIPEEQSQVMCRRFSAVLGGPETLNEGCCDRA